MIGYSVRTLRSDIRFKKKRIVSSIIDNVPGAVHTIDDPTFTLTPQSYDLI